ncbi:hypothetical protein ABK040_011960 [Willaertia magna]
MNPNNTNTEQFREQLLQEIKQKDAEINQQYVVIFDVGGVLATDVHNVFIEDLLFGKIPNNDFLNILQAADIAWTMFELGTITEKQFWEITIDKGNMLKVIDKLNDFKDFTMNDGKIFTENGDLKRDFKTEVNPIITEIDKDAKNKNILIDLSPQETSKYKQEDKELKDKLIDYLAYKLRKCDKIKLHKPTLQLAQILSELPNVAIGILSNHSVEWANFLLYEKDNGIVGKIFSKYPKLITFSCFVKYAKPHEPFYLHLIKNIQSEFPNIEMSRICFVDDKLKNLRTARRLGLHTILYNNGKEDEFPITYLEKNVLTFMKGILLEDCSMEDEEEEGVVLNKAAAVSNEQQQTNNNGEQQQAPIAV